MSRPKKQTLAAVAHRGDEVQEEDHPFRKHPLTRLILLLAGMTLALILFGVYLLAVSQEEKTEALQRDVHVASELIEERCANGTLDYSACGEGLPEATIEAMVTAEED